MLKHKLVAWSVCSQDLSNDLKRRRGFAGYEPLFYVPTVFLSSCRPQDPRKNPGLTGPLSQVDGGANERRSSSLAQPKRQCRHATLHTGTVVTAQADFKAELLRAGVIHVVNRDRPLQTLDSIMLLAATGQVQLLTAHQLP